MRTLHSILFGVKNYFLLVFRRFSWVNIEQLSFNAVFSFVRVFVAFESSEKRAVFSPKLSCGSPDASSEAIVESALWALLVRGAHRAAASFDYFLKRTALLDIEIPTIVSCQPPPSAFAAVAHSTPPPVRIAAASFSSRNNSSAAAARSTEKSSITTHWQTSTTQDAFRLFQMRALLCPLETNTSLRYFWESILFSKRNMKIVFWWFAVPMPFGYMFTTEVLRKS